MSNQSARQAAVREITGATSGGYEQNLMEMFDADGIPSGPFNGRLLAWINEYLGASISSLPGAQQAFADSLGFDNWDSINTWDALAGPENTVAPVVSGDEIVGETLSCTEGTWTGNGSITYAYQWKRDGANISAATSATYELVEADIGAMISCRVTATDDDGSRGANSNSVGPVEGIAPANSAAPAITGTEEVGETLSCSTGTWTGTPTPTYTYQWRRDASNIGGATASTYELVEDDESTMIDCVVTATNVAGSTPQASNEVGPIAGEGGGGGLWAGYFTAAGITNGTAQTAIETFYAGLATDGIQSKIKVFVLLGAESATAKNMMSDAYHGSLVNSPTFTQWLGVRGDAATSYVDTGTAPSGIAGISTNSTCIGIGTNQDAPASGFNYSSMTYLGGESYDGPGMYEACVVNPGFLNNSDQEEFTFVGAVNDGYGASSTPVAWGTLTDVRIYASRTGAATVKTYRGASEILDDTTASEALPTAAMFISAYNSGSPGFSGDDGTFDAKWYLIAEGLSGADITALDARIVTLITALEAL